jgi:hypothetical protein
MSHSPDFMKPEQELEFIRKIISDSRQAMAEDGKPYIVWGLIVAIAMMATYISALTQIDFYTGWIWIGMVAIGIIYSFIELRRQKRSGIERAHSFVDRFGGAIWTACGSALGLTILLIMFGYQLTNPSIPPIFTCSLASIILGIAYFLSGFVNDIKWLRNIAFAWWAGAIAMYFIYSVHVLGLYALMLILFQVVPGIVLNRKYRATQNVPNAPVPQV